MTSHQAVQRVRSCLHQKSVGHCGTLDPMAEGLLLIVLGRACKLSSSLMSSDKIYELTFQLGLVTDTLDRTGKILKESKVDLKPVQIERVLRENLGWLNLTIPRFSAVKFKGKKLYEYARSGQTVPLIKKQMYFYDLKILNIQGEKTSLQLSCKKGGYIRAWVERVGEELGAGACLSHLKRLACPPYSLRQSFLLKDFETICEKEVQKALHFAQVKGAFIPMEKIQS